MLTKFNVKSAQFGGYDYAYDYNYGSVPGRDQAESPRKSGKSRKSGSA